MPAMQDDAMLPTPQAAAVLGLKPQTLHEWRTRRVGPKFYKMGAAVRYRLSDLHAYLDESCVQTNYVAD